MTEEEFIALEELTLARAVTRALESVESPELQEARRQAALATIRLAELVEVEPE